MIELKGVTKKYTLGDETIYALNDISLTFKPGEFVAIMGPSGSGKSTLANIVGGLDVPDDGEVLVDNQPLATLNDQVLSQYRNKKIGFVFQTFNLQPHLSALENVEVPLVFTGLPGKARRAKTLDSLKLVGLADRVNHRPNQLSGGQRQRVAIARALVNDPEIIIADEPTGNLDSTKSKEIMDLLKALNKQKQITLIVITHDPIIAKQADRIINIQDGKMR